MTIGIIECDKCFVVLKKNKSRDKIINASVKFLKTFNFSNRPPNICRVFESEKYQIWKFRIGDPDSNKGKSSSFRLFAYFNISEKVFYIYKLLDKKLLDKNSAIEIEIKKEILKIIMT